MGQGSGTSFGGFGSVDTGIPEPYGVDPSIAPGLPRMEGWRVVLPDGSAAWDKTGPLDTDWTLVAPGAGGDVTALVAGDAGIVLTNPGGPIVTVGQRAAAEEDRIYTVDFVNGLDTNAGYAVLPAGANAAQYAAACVAAGLVAKKTIAGSAIIRPPAGNNHSAELIVCNGGVNTAQAYTDDIGVWTTGLVGYNNIIIRGTGTSTTAGAVAFDGTTNDLDYQGAVTATGCNAAGYNPVAAFSTTVIKGLKVGGGAAAIPVEPAMPLGMRIRFDNATTTAALRNVCRQIAEVQGTDTVVVQTALPAVPVGTDTYYFEMGGWTVPTATLHGLNSGVTLNNKISGFRCVGTMETRDTEWRYVFCSCNLLTVTSGGFNSQIVAQTLTHPTLGTRTIGGGLRVETGSSASTCMQVTGVGLVIASTFVMNNAIGSWLFGVGCFATGMLWNNTIKSAGTTSNTTNDIGGTAALAAPRIVGAGRLRIISSQITLGILSVTNAGASAGAISLEGRCVVAFNGVVSGSTGNNDVGLDLTLSRGSLIILTTTPTVTGALGDVRLVGGQIVTWAQAIATGITDSAGNRIIGTAGVPPQGMETKSGVLLSSLAGAQFTYIADENPTSLGALVVINNIVPVRWPTSFRLATRLRACYLQPDPATKAIVVTLYKNNVATAMTVTITNGSAVGTKFVDTAHPILFLDGDDWAIRLDVAQAGAEGATAYAVGVTLEWAT